VVNAIFFFLRGLWVRHRQCGQLFSGHLKLLP
jgi:hypothetical protein